MKITPEWIALAFTAGSLAITSLIAWVTLRTRYELLKQSIQQAEMFRGLLDALKCDLALIRSEMQLARHEERITELVKRIRTTERDCHWTRNIFNRIGHLLTEEKQHEFQQAINQTNQYITERWADRD